MLRNKVLSFNQPAEFFVKKAEKHADAGKLIEALQMYRQVLGMEPHNIEYLLCIAQIYSEMGLYAESNDVLLKIARFGNTPTECLFALGCNYMGMKNYALADEAFEQYLAIDPEGEYVAEIDELFDILDEEESYEEGLHDVNRQMLIDEAYKGKQFLDKGDYKSAIDHLEKVVKRDNTMYSAKNNLALSYFFDGQKQKAIRTALHVIEAQHLNLHACCNLAFFYSDLGDYERAEEYISKIEKIGDIQPEDMHKVALTYCELGYHDNAYKWFAKIANLQPYDIRILHFCGLAAYNHSLYNEARGCFVRILKIDPNNCLASYYLKKVKDASKNGAGKIFEYVYQVQFDEIKHRIKYLNDCLKKKHHSLNEQWNNDEYFKSVIMWGLHYGDEYIKKIVIEIMCMFSDDHVEEEFRSFLLKSTETDEIKNDIFIYLKRMGAKEPYIAYIKGAIAEVRVGNVADEIENIPKPYAAALSCFIRNAQYRYGDDFVTSGVEIMAALAKEKNDDGVWIKKPEALAGALECYVSGLFDSISRPLEKELAKVYGIGFDIINEYYDIMTKDTKEGDD